MTDQMHIVITGADGFIGQHLMVRLRESGRGAVRGITRSTSAADRDERLAAADVVVHLAGVNRPTDSSEFDTGNAGSTAALCADLRRLRRQIPVIYSSSVQADQDNPYGRSKRAAEQHLMAYAAETGAHVAYFRFCNVFGKWARPDYNSAVATFCHNVSRGLPITVHDASAPLWLLYIDDAVAAIERLLSEGIPHSGEYAAGPIYETTVGAVAESIQAFSSGRKNGTFGHVGSGLARALYATYVSYLPADAFSYPIQQHEDARGVFAEFLRTPNAGQISYFTAHPGITRGGHYHHTKTEKFLVVQGRARFGFRHVVTGERRFLEVTSAAPTVVDTVPGWVHDITNIGGEQLIVLLWANEAFDPTHPDTIAMGVAE